LAAAIESLAKLFHSLAQGDAAMVVIAKDILRHDSEGRTRQKQDEDTMQRVRTRQYDAVMKTITASKTSDVRRGKERDEQALRREEKMG
jgi:hypothetical protein